jgi:hypothetical protein
MRIRSVKPIFWRDRELARLGDEARLFYIGLWMQADDAGWFRWNADEIAADLYPFLTERARLRKVEKCLDALTEMPGPARLYIHDCGHAELTRFLDHQKSGMPGQSGRVYTFLKQHERCPRSPARTREEPRSLARDVGRDGTTDGTGRDGAHDGSNEPEKRPRLVYVNGEWRAA